MSVKMPTCLCENDFTPEQRRDMPEDCFPGRIPEEVKREAEKESKQKEKAD